MNTPLVPTCPKCAAPLPVDAPKGLCPRCLAAMNLATETGFTGADAVAAQTPLTPTELAPHFPHLEILECLGRGGMGVVYKARQKSLNRLTALKLLAPERADDPSFAERFAEEAQALAALNHPHIVGVYDFGQAGGFYFLLMEFVDGVNLRQAMKAGRFTPEQALAVVPPVCEALQYAHEQGIVHRDIKPENLLLDKTGRVKIADFGIAKILERGGAELPLGPDIGAALQRGATTPETLASAAGTPQYMAPEQKAHRATDHRADIYSLGVVLYELLTGELPTDKLQPPSRKVQIDVRLDEIVLRALEAKPELRYQTVAELRTQVETVVATPASDRGQPIESGRPQRTEGSLAAGVSKSATGPLRLVVVGRSGDRRVIVWPNVMGVFLVVLGCGVLGQMVLSHFVPVSVWELGALAIFLALIATAGVITGGLRTPLARLTPLETVAREPSGAPDGMSKRQPRWQGCLLGLCLATFGALWLERLQQGIQDGARALTPVEASNGMLGTGLATLILLAGTAFLWMLARNIEMLGWVASTKRALGRTIVPALAMVVLLRTFVLQSFQVATNAATPEIPRGSYVLTWKLARSFARGDLVVFRHDSHSNVGRVTGSEADAVLVNRNGVEDFRVPTRNISGKVISVLWRGAATSGVTQFDIAPVGVSNNVVIVDVTAEVGQGNAELRAVLDGPALPAASEVPLFAGTFVKPTEDPGSHPFRILWPGRQIWRLGFVLPDAALAKEAFEGIRPIGPLPAAADRTFAGTIFNVRLPNGQEVHASLQVGLPFNSNDPNSVSVFGHCEHDRSVVALTWQVLASGSGLAQFSRAGSPILTLRHDPHTMLHGVNVRLELIQAGTNRVQFVRHIGGDPIREELDGNFRELADELLRTANFGAKATSGTRIELCQFQGKPFSVQVDVPASTITTSVPVKTVSWRVLFFLTIGLFVVGVIVRFVVLVRKGGTATKVTAVLGGVALLLFLALVGLFFFYAKLRREGAIRAETIARQAARTESQRIERQRATDDFPTGAHIGRNGHSVLVVHDSADLHYVFFHAGDFSSSSFGSHNAETRSWVDEGSVKLRNGRTFGYRREAPSPDELTVNGARYDLRLGRVFVLLGDGTLARRSWSVPLSLAKDPVALGRFISEHGGLPESAGAVWRVRNEARQATIDADVNAGEELLVFIGEESLGWASSPPKAGEVTATVEASTTLRREDGSLEKGFIVRTMIGPSRSTANVANVAMTPDGPVPFGELVFRANDAVFSKDGVFTFADIHKPDGALVPVSVRVRKGQLPAKRADPPGRK